MGESGLIAAPKKAKMNAKVTSTCYVVNRGDSAYVGEVSAWMMTDKNTTPKLLDKQTIKQNKPLMPGDSVEMTAKFDVLNSYFAKGSNIVVIWPTGTTVKTIDSLKTPLEVEGDTTAPQDTTTDTTTTGIWKKTIALGGVSLYPNPATERLYLKVPQGQQAARLEIYDISGKTMRVLGREEVLECAATGLSVQGWPAGMYTCAVHFSDGRQMWVKVSVSGK